MAFVFIPTATVALHAVGNHDAGVASAVINTSQQVGGALGTAITNTVAVTATSSFLAANASLGDGALPTALTHGYTRAFILGGLLLVVAAVVVAAVVVLALIRIGPAAAAEDDDASAAVHFRLTQQPRTVHPSPPQPRPHRGPGIGAGQASGGPPSSAAAT